MLLCAVTLTQSPRYPIPMFLDNRVKGSSVVVFFKIILRNNPELILATMEMRQLSRNCNQLQRSLFFSVKILVQTTAS